VKSVVRGKLDRRRRRRPRELRFGLLLLTSSRRRLGRDEVLHRGPSRHVRTSYALLNIAVELIPFSLLYLAFDSTRPSIRALLRSSFPYDLIYPEQYNYMCDLKKTLDAGVRPSVSLTSFPPSVRWLPSAFAFT
jgi:hypothetical protein